MMQVPKMTVTVRNSVILHFHLLLTITIIPT